MRNSAVSSLCFLVELLWFSFTNERERCSWLHVGLDNPICIKVINSSCCIASLQSLYASELLIQKVFQLPVTSEIAIDKFGECVYGQIREKINVIVGTSYFSMWMFYHKGSSYMFFKFIEMFLLHVRFWSSCVHLRHGCQPKNFSAIPGC